jgi:hypothetical protein
MDLEIMTMAHLYYIWHSGDYRLTTDVRAIMRMMGLSSQLICKGASPF